MLRSPSDECFWNNLLVHEPDAEHAFAGERPAVATAVASAVSPAPSGGASVFRAPSVTAGPSLLPVPVVGEEGAESADASPGNARKRATPYAAWSLAEDTALVARLEERGVAGSRLGERAMQQLELAELPQLAQRSFKAIYNRYNKHLQWRAKRAPRGSTAWLREMHEAEKNGASDTPKRKKSETKSGASEGRELAGWEGAKLSEGELWLSAAWADGSSDWQRAADVRGSEYAPQLLEYYEGLFEELTN